MAGQSRSRSLVALAAGLTLTLSACGGSDGGTAQLDRFPGAHAERLPEPADQMLMAAAELVGDLREAFLLKHVEERSYDEMSDLTGAGVSALKMRVKRATELLRERLEREGRLGETERELESARSNARSATTARDELEQRHAADLRDMESLRTALAEEQSRRKWAEEAEHALGDKVAAFEEQQREANELIASLKDYIEGRRSRWEQQDSELETRERTLKDQLKDIERLTKDVRHSTERLDREKSARESAEAHAAALEKDVAEMRARIDTLNAAVSEQEAAAGASRSEVDELHQALEAKSTALWEAEAALADVRGERIVENLILASGRRRDDVVRPATFGDVRTRASRVLARRGTGDAELLSARFMEQLESSPFIRDVTLVRTTQSVVGESRQVAYSFEVDAAYVQPPIRINAGQLSGFATRRSAGPRSSICRRHRRPHRPPPEDHLRPPILL